MNFDFKVYQVSANDSQLKEVKRLNFSMIEFENWYNPNVELVKESDYSLMRD